MMIAPLCKYTKNHYISHFKRINYLKTYSFEKNFSDLSLKTNLLTQIAHIGWDQSSLIVVPKIFSCMEK